MRKNRAGQAASVVRPLTPAEYDAAWWGKHIRLCLLGRQHNLPGHGRMNGRAGLAQDVENDPKLLNPPKIEPFDSAEDRRIWRMLHGRRITRHITRILPNVDADAPTLPSRRYWFHNDETIADSADPNRTQPIPALHR